MDALKFTSRDSHPPEETACVDEGLHASNEAAAPLHEVQPIACFVHAPDGELIGGVIGRRWGQYCELQRLWVRPSHRRRGIGAMLVKRFEDHAISLGCTDFYLETFSFQAPGLYRALGYRVEYERVGYPHGITKSCMVKRMPALASS